MRRYILKYFYIVLHWLGVKQLCLDAQYIVLCCDRSARFLQDYYDVGIGDVFTRRECDKLGIPHIHTAWFEWVPNSVYNPKRYGITRYW